MQTLQSTEKFAEFQNNLPIYFTQTGRFDWKADQLKRTLHTVKYIVYSEKKGLLIKVRYHEVFTTTGPSQGLKIREGTQ